MGIPYLCVSQHEHPSPRRVTKMVFLLSTFNIYSLSNCQIYNTVLLTMIKACLSKPILGFGLWGWGPLGLWLEISGGTRLPAHPPLQSPSRPLPLQGPPSESPTTRISWENSAGYTALSPTGHVPPPTHTHGHMHGHTFSPSTIIIHDRPSVYLRGFLASFLAYTHSVSDHFTYYA